MTGTRKLWVCAVVASGEHPVQIVTMVVVASAKSVAIGIATQEFYALHSAYPGNCEAFEVDNEAIMHGFPDSIEFTDPEACVIGGVLGKGRVGFTRNEDTIVVFAAFRSPTLAEAMQHLRDDGLAHSTCAKIIKQVIGDMPDDDVPAEWTNGVTLEPGDLENLIDAKCAVGASARENAFEAMQDHGVDISKVKIPHDLDPDGVHDFAMRMCHDQPPGEL